MWMRCELKDRAKAAFKANYWRCVLVALILMIIGGGISFRFSINRKNGETVVQEQQIREALSSIGLNDPAYQQGFVQGYQWIVNPQNTRKLTAVAGGMGMVSLALSILVFNPFIVGGYRFFLQNRRGDGELKHLIAGFQDNWGNVILGMFLKNLFIALWSLLFVIPGIIKLYSYRMVPYLLKEHPELTGKQAITISRRMMNGHKWRTFVLDLSFIGWLFLSALTLGILHIFYVGPYMQATDAELYEAVRAEYEARAV